MLRPHQFVDITLLTHEVSDASDIFRIRNSIYFKKKEEYETIFDVPDFLIDDDGIIDRFPVKNPLKFSEYSQKNTSTFIAGLDNVIVDFAPSDAPGRRTFNVFPGEGISLADNYEGVWRSELMAQLWGELLRVRLGNDELAVPIYDRREPDTEIDEPVFFLCTRLTPDNYYHWLFEGVNRLWPIVDGLIGDTIPILFPTAEPKPFHTDVLKALGIRNPIIALNRSTPRFRKLIFPSFLVPGGPTAERIGWMRTHLLPAAGVAPPRGRRIYISRAGAGTRRVLNEHDVAATLAIRGFETVRLEDMGFLDQIRLFAGADIVLAPHGAGLTNIVFCPPDAKVGEFVTRDNRPPLFWTIAKAMGLRYGRLTVEPLPGGDLLVDTGKLATLADAMVAA